jgi:hypothetical protein
MQCDFKISFYVNLYVDMLFRKRKRVGQFVIVGVVVWRNDEYETTVKKNDDDGCSSDDVVL